MYTDNTDGDGDGVGDKCDPHAGDPGDVAAAFYGFYEGTDISTWNKAGMWSIDAPGVLLGDHNNTGGAYLEPPTTFEQNLAIYTSMDVLAGSGGSEAVAGPSARRESLTTLQACVTTNSPTVGYRVYVNNAASAAEQSVATAFNATHDMTMIVDGTSGRCTVDGSSIMLTPVRVAATRIAVTGQNVIMKVDYIFVVKMP